MSVFMGNYEHTLDDKNRVGIPSKFRKHFPNKLRDCVLTIGYGGDRCLSLYPMEQWKKVTEAINRSSQFQKDARNLRRLIYGQSVEVHLDKQYRFPFPSDLKKRIGIENKVIFLGCGEIIELWSPVKFDDHNNGLTESYKENAFELLVREQHKLGESYELQQSL